MAQFLVIARFPGDAVPLRLFDSDSLAEEVAKRTARDPELLDSVYSRSFAATYHGRSLLQDGSDLVSVIVVRINGSTGYPEAIVSEWTAGEDDATPEQPAQGPGQLESASPVKPAASDDLPHDYHMTYATVLDLRVKVEELQKENARLGVELADLKSLNTDLRAMNTELHNRVTALRGSEPSATKLQKLEKLATAVAIRLVGQYEKIAMRCTFAHEFGAEGLMEKSYGKALSYCVKSLRWELEAFIKQFPHVLPHIPEEFHPDCCSGDGDGDGEE